MPKKSQTDLVPRAVDVKFTEARTEKMELIYDGSQFVILARTKKKQAKG